MKAWETIRLLLACQDSRARLRHISAKQSELHRRLDDLHQTQTRITELIRNLDSEYASLCEDEAAKFAEIASLEIRKHKLQAELGEAKSNTLYREISQEIERNKQRIRELESDICDIFERKYTKDNERKEAREKEEALRQQGYKEEQRIEAVRAALTEDERHEKKYLRGLEQEFSTDDQWLNHFRRLVGKGRYNVVVEAIEETCPGCNLGICTDLLQKARDLDQIVKCENCDRIVFSTSGSTLFCPTDVDIEGGRLLLPPHLALQIKQSLRIRDIWGSWHEGKIKGDWLTGLADLFEAHALSPGEKVKLIKMGGSEDSWRFEPEMISSQELDKVIARIETSDHPLNLENLVSDLLAKKLHVYRPKLLCSRVRSDLEKVEGIYFRGNLVWHSPLLELPVPPAVPPPVISPTPAHLPPSFPSETTITLEEEAIKAGVLPIGAVFRIHFKGTDSGEIITVRYGVSEDFAVEFDAIAQVLKGDALLRWYQSNGLEAGDKVTLSIRNGEHRLFQIHTEWARDLDHLLEQAQHGNLGYSGPPRDLLYGLLAEIGHPLHYRDLWSRAAEISNLRIGTVVSTLSRYNKRLFCSTGSGRWALFEWPTEKFQQETQGGDGSSLIAQLSPRDEQALWKAIVEIENHDLVYKLLKNTAIDMSYSAIARHLAEMLNINAYHLIETSFLNWQDERFHRLANGSWTLKEYVISSPSDFKPVTPPINELRALPEKPVTHVTFPRWLWYVLVTLIGVVALVWFLATK